MRKLPELRGCGKVVCRPVEKAVSYTHLLEIVRMVKAVKMDNKELTAFLKAYASGMISLPEGMLQEGNTERCV